MGNRLTVAVGDKKKAKVMRIDGEIFKLKTPINVFEAIKDYPGHVLLESKAFKRFGIRANPMNPEEYLEGGKVYFLVELPKLPETSRRVKVRLPKAEVEKLIGESRDEVELAERIVDVYVNNNKKKKADGDGSRLGGWR